MDFAWILNCRGKLIDFCLFDHHLNEKNNLYCLNKSGSRVLYQIKIAEKYKKTILQLHYEEYFIYIVSNWNSMYLLPSMATVNTKLNDFSTKN